MISLLINYIYKDKRVYKKYGKEIQTEYLNKKIFKLKNIIDSLTIIENLDYRLVYYFLKKYYGNNKLKKILWNIEMNAMDGKENNINDFKLKLTNIKYSDDEIRKHFFGNKKDGKYLAGDSRGWSLSSARNKIGGNVHSIFIQKIDYRP